MTLRPAQRYKKRIMQECTAWGGGGGSSPSLNAKHTFLECFHPMARQGKNSEEGDHEKGFFFLLSAESKHWNLSSVWE